MTPVDQTVVDKQRGNCHQAAMASLLNLELEQVPNFRLFPDDNWHQVMSGFLWGCGYEWHGTGYPTQRVVDYPNVDECVLATVPSKEFDDPKITHMVVMNNEGVVVHDPQPNKAYQDANILETGKCLHWALIGGRK